HGQPPAHPAPRPPSRPGRAHPGHGHQPPAESRRGRRRHPPRMASHPPPPLPARGRHRTPPTRPPHPGVPRRIHPRQTRLELLHPTQTATHRPRHDRTHHPLRPRSHHRPTQSRPLHRLPRRRRISPDRLHHENGRRAQRPNPSHRRLRNHRPLATRHHH